MCDHRSGTGYIFSVMRKYSEEFIESAPQNITSDWQFSALDKQKSFQSASSLLCNLCKSISTTE